MALRLCLSVIIVILVVQASNLRRSVISYQNFDQDTKKLEVNRQQKQQHKRLLTSTSGGLSAFFELEVKDAENISICSYSVESIPDTRGTRMPKDLVHIKCNVIGSKCTGDHYCCIQTYRYVEVSYSEDEGSEKLKIYTGCVCALQDLNNVSATLVVQSNNTHND